MEETALIDMNQVFFSTSSKSKLRLMLANVEKEYAFRTVESPVVAESLQVPNRPDCNSWYGNRRIAGRFRSFIAPLY